MAGLLFGGRSRMKVEQARLTAGFAEASHSQDLGPSPDIRPPAEDRTLAEPAIADNVKAGLERTALMFLAILLMTFIGVTVIFILPDLIRNIMREGQNSNHVVAHIIQAESNGCTNLKNKRSTASGPGQFIETTWLQLIRKYRPDLAHLPRAELLDLRHDLELSREMTTRFAEGNANVLRRHGQSVTPGTLYLSHFAGSAGAVAILTAPETADAAAIMANADASGRITRDIIVNANPFLREFTIADLKGWADRKMQRQAARQGNLQSCRS